MSPDLAYRLTGPEGAAEAELGRCIASLSSRSSRPESALKSRP